MMRDRMKAMDFWKLAAILAVLMSALPFAAYGADGQKSAPAKKASSAKAASAGQPCPNPPPCKEGHTCSNYPFRPTDCWTTQYGPAKADVIIPDSSAKTQTAVSSTNMLYCEGNTYALCFFSGPPNATGKTSSTNNPLPCTLSKDGKTADCTCQAYTSGPNFVDINGILNQGAYFKTVDVCGQDGSRCKNIVNCGPKGDPSECKKRPEAPVCKYVANQGTGSPEGWLWPKANLISTFSFAMSPVEKDSPHLPGPYVLGTTSCSAGLYAGCMTAPCSYGPQHGAQTTNGELVTCKCPTYNGVYQVGQAHLGQWHLGCSISPSNGNSYVWSASNTVKAGSSSQ